MTNVTSHKSHIRTSQCYVMESHDEYGRVVYRPCSSCISSVQNPIETLLSSCQLRLGVILRYLSLSSYTNSQGAKNLVK